jgi:hypothetical protein
VRWERGWLQWFRTWALCVGEGGWKWDEVGTELRGIEGVGIYMRD